MISTAIELLALAGLVKTASLFAVWAAWLVGSLGLLFIGYALGGSPVDVQAARALASVRRALRRQIARENALAGSPHPEIHVDPVMQEWADRAAESRRRRGTRVPALSRADYNGDVADD
jgi:hypothetical protein